MAARAQPKLTAGEARRMRLVAQGLHRTRGARGAVRDADGGRTDGGRAIGGGAMTPAGVVRRMVAMQGQDLPQVLRAIAIRCAPGTTLDDVRAAFDRGELVRSWAMRGTLFVATPQDLAELHRAVGERMRRREWRLCLDRGIDEPIAARAAEALVEALADGPISRPALLAAWESAGVDTGGGRGYHLLALCAYDELVRFGPFAGTSQLLVGGTPPAVGAHGAKAASRSVAGERASGRSAGVDRVTEGDTSAAGLDGVVERVAAAR
ncbi:DNA glycosylase AlkZ-like family protein, partial [Arsenicicoccus bolidensis]|uniref:DNA glycosylase AlkZ-like family protein n=1 Tax=Arsenicicoccus bolidensis TaxID=229480 RepID=UPI0028B165EF